jgi:hypothetical protein
MKGLEGRNDEMKGGSFIRGESLLCIIGVLKKK